MRVGTLMCWSMYFFPRCIRSMNLAVRDQLTIFKDDCFLFYNQNGIRCMIWMVRCNYMLMIMKIIFVCIHVYAMSVLWMFWLAIYSISLPHDSDIAVQFLKRSAKICAPSEIAHTGTHTYQKKSVGACAYMLRHVTVRSKRDKGVHSECCYTCHPLPTAPRANIREVKWLRQNVCLFSPQFPTCRPWQFFIFYLPSRASTMAK